MGFYTKEEFNSQMEMQLALGLNVKQAYHAVCEREIKDEIEYLRYHRDEHDWETMYAHLQD